MARYPRALGSVTDGGDGGGGGGIDGGVEDALDTAAASAPPRIGSAPACVSQAHGCTFLHLAIACSRSLSHIV
jgi:hypothetical protein